MTTLPLLLLACAAQVERPSVLLIVLDDIGTDQIAAHPNAGEDPPPTPYISTLAAEGLQFTNCWGAPRCSPSRSEILTGRFPFRTGIGDIVNPGEVNVLALSEVTIAERLSARGYRTAMLGKWHLSNEPEDPCAQGFESWSGAQANLDDYWDWGRVDDAAGASAALSQSAEYNTSALTDAALAWLGSNTEPYFLALNYHAAHKPTHCPPVAMQTQCTELSGARDQFRGMVESVDYEIGRLLAAVNRADTTVIVVGDNGTHEDWTSAPNKSKGTCYRLGIEIPLIFWGDAVDEANQGGLEDSGHVNVADLYKTLLKLMPGNGDAGMQVLPLDSVSVYNQGTFASSRPWNFAERFTPLGAGTGPYTVLHRAVEDAAGYKLIERESGARELYDTAVDPDETADLLADGTSAFEQSVLDSLDAILGGLGL